MLAEMTSREFGEWMAFYSLEPFGPMREDLRAGTIAATMVNLRQKRNSNAIVPADFFPELATREETPEAKQETGGISAAAAIAATLAMGGRVIRRSVMKQ
jgi:hypothetical protein